MASLNANPLINANSDTVSEIVTAHNKNIRSIFNQHNPFEDGNDFMFDDLDNDDDDIKMDDDNECEDEEHDEFTELEIFDMLRGINDPEHPLTLEQLNVIKLDDITINEKNKNKILVRYTPTIPHCSMATLIGLSIRVKLLRSLPPRFKVRIEITPKTHQSEKEITKQINDKERVCAALENYSLIKVVNQCIKTSLK